MIIRQATEGDIDFIIDAIIEAEKSGSDLISYCAIFSITESELRTLLRNILEEDVPGHELSLSSYLVAEIDGKVAATLGAFIENEDGLSSNMIKSNMFMYFMDRQVLMNAADKIKVLDEISIEREKGAFQIEVSYTLPEFRGSGAIAKLVDEHIRLKKEEGKKFSKLQGILLKNNEKSLKSVQKAGFVVVNEKSTDNKQIFDLLPSNTKLLIEKEVNL